METGLNAFKEALHLKHVEAGEYSPLALAYIGDAAYRRGRNAKSFTMPKHATMKDYRMATGFEALMGYLYLTEQFDRMAELLGKGLEQMGELAEAEGTSTDSHALQEAENEK